MPTLINPSGQTITQYNVQTGGANNLLNNVTPSTAGYVLTSNGVSAQPSFQAVPSSFSPNAVVQLYDDFIGQLGTGVDQYVLNWNNFTNGGGSYEQYSSSDPAHPGIFTNNNITSAACNLSLVSNSTVANIALGGGAISFTWILKILTLSNSTNRYILRCGLSDAVGTTDAANGVYFEYSDNENSGQWIGKTAASSTRTTANSAIAAQTSSYVNLTITVNAAATSVAYFINGTQISNSPITSNIPTVGITPFIMMQYSAGTVAAGSVIVDMFSFSQTLTTPR